MFKVTNLKDKLPNNSTISASDCGGLKRPKVKLSLWSMIFSGGLGIARNLSFGFWKIATLQYSTTFKEIHLLSLLSQQKKFSFLLCHNKYLRQNQSLLASKPIFHLILFALSNTNNNNMNNLIRLCILGIGILSWISKIKTKYLQGILLLHQIMLHNDFETLLAMSVFLFSLFQSLLLIFKKFF